MAKTLSKMSALGTAAADFALPDARGHVVRKKDFADKPLLVMFLCNHCPYVKHLRHSLGEFGRAYQPRGLGIVAINANDAQAYPEDAPEKMLVEAEEAGYTFPYLVDESQQTALAYEAACTPDFFLFDAQHQLVYRGQYDGSRPGAATPITGDDLRAAAEAVLAQKPVAIAQKASMGCNIKWKVGTTLGP